MSEVTVGVVIPTHNRPDLLQKAVASVLTQDVPGLRLVVVDEASDPPAADVLEVSDPRVEVVRNYRPRGPAAARNQGIDLIRSEFVGFLDDDDRWLPGKLRETLACFERYPAAGMVIHRMGSSNNPDGTGECRVVADPVRRMLTRQPPHVDAVLVRRSVHDQVRFDEEFSAAEDLDYMLRAAMVGDVAELDRVLGVHGPSGSGMTAIALEKRIAGRLRFREKHADLFRDRETRAFNEIRLGHLYRRAGDRRQALAAFLRSLRLVSTSSLSWKGLISLAIPNSLLVRLSRRNGDLTMTTMVKLRYEAKKARKSAKFALAHLGTRPSVIVYQMGKVGSQTVTETLRASAPHLRVFHVHSLTREGLADAERRYRRSFPRDRRVAQHFIEGRYLRRRVGDSSKWPWKVITLCRDPIAQNISGFFQTLRYHPDLSVREWSPGYQQALTDRFLSTHPHRRPLDWFDTELNRSLEVDVYARPFPRQQGHAVFSSDRADVLLIRLEDLSRCARHALSSFLGIRDLELVSTNVAADKAYADLYARFTKELVLPRQYVESMYGSRYARHFYSDDELVGFRGRWLKDRG